eukprot:COSAG06_NODE_9672_length_1846_cov_15.172868_1_plen_51_part_00
MYLTLQVKVAMAARPQLVVFASTLHVVREYILSYAKPGPGFGPGLAYDNL